MYNKDKFNPYIHLVIYICCAVLYTYSIDISMLDDGLRHIAFAANKDVMISWGNVYPHSLFTDYDPWFGWHFLLKTIMLFVPYENVHHIVNFFALFSFMILSHKVIEKYSKYNFSSLLYILVFVLTILTSFRYVMVRPDMLSGFYVMSAILLSNRFFPVFLLTLLYIPFYYLFFLYTGSIGLVYLIQQKYKLFLGVFLASVLGLVFFLVHNFDSYITNVIQILTDQSLRAGLAVREGLPIFDFLRGFNYYILIALFFVGCSYIIWKKYSYFKENTLALFLLVTSLLWINQYRYFHLFLPLIFIYVFLVFVNIDKKRFFYNLRKYFTLAKKYFTYSKNKKLFYIIAIPYSIVMLSIIFSDFSYNKLIEKAKAFQDSKYDGKIILYNKMNTDMFSLHYYNPKVKIVPSCSIGWFEQENEHIRKIYINLQSLSSTVTEEELKELISYTNADYYIHFFKNENQEFDIQKLISLGIIPEKIYDNKIIFKIKKSSTNE